ncbi:MAG: MbnP family protein, partial [Flavitalea sp.]
MKYILIVIIALSLSSCSKDTGGFDQQTIAPLSIEFDNIVGGKNLILNSETYTNKTGERFNISLLQYYISN